MLPNRKRNRSRTNNYHKINQLENNNNNNNNNKASKNRNFLNNETNPHNPILTTNQIRMIAIMILRKNINEKEFSHNNSKMAG